MKLKKTKIAGITLILMLTLSATIITLPLVSTHDPPINIRSYAYVTSLFFGSTQQKRG